MRERAAFAFGMFVLVGCGGGTSLVTAPMSVAPPVATTTAAPVATAVAPPALASEATTPPSSAPRSPPGAVMQLAPAVTAAIAPSVESFYAMALPFECDFAIEFFSKATNARQNAQMHLVFVRPGEFRATFSSGEVIVAHARGLASSDPTTRQVYRRAVPADFCPSALSYAGGPGALTNHLAFVAYPGAAMNAPALDVLVAMPLQPAPPVAKILFYAAPTGEVRRTLIVMPSGDRQRFDAVRCAMNVAPPGPSLFATPLLSPVPSAMPSSGAPGGTATMTTALP